MLNHFPRLSTIFLLYVAVGLLFFFLGTSFFQNFLLPFGIIGVFIAGALYTYSFTAPIGALMLVALAPDYPIGIMAVVGGIGAVLADITIFKFIRNNLKKEIEHIARSQIICTLGSRELFCRRWFRNFLGALILTSPLPDELGIAMMSTAKIKPETFILITFIMDTLGIYLLVSVVNAVF